MNEQNEKINNEIDLGSDPINDDFDPFASDDDFGVEITDKSVQQESLKNEISSTMANSLKKTINKAEDKSSEQVQQGPYEKSPVFEYAGVTENIDDTAKTFDMLRIEKADDFPELQDGKHVSWTVEYGKITKPVSDPKVVTIDKIKSEIETSKEFMDSLKKSKEKKPVLQGKTSCYRPKQRRSGVLQRSFY